MKNFTHKFLLSITLLLILFGQPTAEIAAQTEGEGSPFPDLDIVVLLDESNSMFTETDKNDRRLQAVLGLIDTLQTFSQSNQGQNNHRLSVIQFETEAEIITTAGKNFVDLNNMDEVNIFKDKLVQNHNALRGNATSTNGRGWTDVSLALDRAEEVLLNHDSDRKVAFIILTDGIPETTFATLRDPANNGFISSDAAAQHPLYIDEIVTKAQTLSNLIQYTGNICPQDRAPIHTITLRSSNDPGSDFSPVYNEPEVNNVWKLISSNSDGANYDFNRAAANSATFETEFLNSLNEILLQQLICADRIDQGAEQSPSVEPIRIPIEANFTKVFLNILKDSPEIEVTITDPQQNQITAERENVFLIETGEGLIENWFLDRPEDLSGWTGEWQVTLSGNGNVSYEVLSTSDVFQLNRRSAQILAYGDQLVAQYELLDSSGTPIAADQVRNIMATITDASGNPVEASTAYLDGILSVSVPEAVVVDQGSFNVALLMELQDRDGNWVPQKSQADITVSAIPWIEIDQPQPSDDGIYRGEVPGEIVANFMLETSPYQGINVNQIAATLFDRNMTGPISTVALQPDPNTPGRYRGRFPEDTPPGTYFLQVVGNISSLRGGTRDLSKEVVVQLSAQSGEAESNPIQIEIPTDTPVVTVLPTATTVPTATPVPTPTPTQVPLGARISRGVASIFNFIPLQLIYICGGFLGLLGLGYLITGFLRSRPRFDPDSFLSYGGRRLYFESGVANLGSQTVDILSQQGDMLAKLSAYPREDGQIFMKVVQLNEDFEAECRFLNQPYWDQQSDPGFSLEPGNRFEILYTGIEHGTQRIDVTYQNVTRQ